MLRVSVCDGRRGAAPALPAPPPLAPAPACASRPSNGSGPPLAAGPFPLILLSVQCKIPLQVLGFTEPDPTLRLHHAVANGDAAGAAAALAAGAAVDRPVKDVQSLFLACKLGQAECAKLLLAAGADRGWRSRDGATPLHAAASGRLPGHTRCAAELLAAGSDPLAVDRSGWLPLHTAAHHGNAAIVQLMLSAAPHMALAQHGGGLTALHQAAFSGRAAAVRVLLAAAPHVALLRWVAADCVGPGARRLSWWTGARPCALWIEPRWCSTGMHSADCGIGCALAPQHSSTQRGLAV